MPAREELADLYRALDRPVDEMRHLQELARSDPQVLRTVAIALAEARGGQVDRALGTLADVSSRSPADPRVQLALARVHLSRAERTGDRRYVQVALEVLESALGAKTSEQLTAEYYLQSVPQTQKLGQQGGAA